MLWRKKWSLTEERNFLRERLEDALKLKAEVPEQSQNPTASHMESSEDSTSSDSSSDSSEPSRKKYKKKPKKKKSKKARACDFKRVKTPEESVCRYQKVLRLVKSGSTKADAYNSVGVDRNTIVNQAPIAELAVVYRSGSQNRTADCLSRLPLQASEEDFSDAEPEFVAFVATSTEFASASASCPELTSLRAQIDGGWPSSSMAVNKDLRPYFQIRDEFSVQKNYVFRGARLLVPVSLQHMLVNLAHDGHQGIVCTKQRLRELYWWPGIDSLVEEKVKNCQVCISSDKTAIVSAAPLQPVPYPSGPWEKVAVDIVGPFETATWDCRYMITLIDYHSKWPEVAFTSSITTQNVIKFLTSVFGRFGNPQYLVSDNGGQFRSVDFAEFLKRRDIQHICTSVYHPAANGAIERFHRVLKSCIQSAIVSGKPWNPTIVIQFLQVYRATPHSATGLSPFELFCCRKIRTCLNILPPPVTGKSVVSQKVSLSQKKMKAYTDSRRRARTPNFKQGDWVRIQSPVHVPKRHPKFSKPLQITRQIGSCTYQLSDGKKWHVSYLSPTLAPIECSSRNELVALPLHSGSSSTSGVLVKNELSNSPIQVPLPADPSTAPERVPARVRRPPRWLQDYVT